MDKAIVTYQDLGRISYADAFAYQKERQTEVITAKRAEEYYSNYFLLCEHNPVYTLGKSGAPENLLFNEEALKAKGIEFHKTNRGGDITYHGPGQITGYPIFNMDDFYHDLHKYVRDMEEVIIRTIAEYNLKGIRMDGYTGVWLAPDDSSPLYRKICAIGVHMSRWVSMHGFGLNVNTDLMMFQGIIPCGIVEDTKTVTSIAKEVGSEIDMGDVKKLLQRHMSDVYDYKYV